MNWRKSTDKISMKVRDFLFRNSLTALVLVASLFQVGCNQQLTDWVGKSKDLPKLPAIPPVTVPVVSTAPVSGYAFSSAGQTTNSVNYKLHFRAGKFDHTYVLNGTNYKLRTGLSQKLKDL
jgi:hypothetical protein